MKTEVIVISDVGNVRANNEDNYCVMSEYNSKSSNHLEARFQIRKNKQLFGVFDGMGGYSNGELASLISAETCVQEFSRKTNNISKDWLNSLFLEMNQRVCNKSSEDSSNMGSTATIAVLDKQDLIIGHIGDSKIFKIRDNSIFQISIDHIDERSKYLGKTKGLLTQFIGVHEEDLRIEPQIELVQVEKGDIYILCSDGMTDVINQDSILDSFNQNQMNIEETAKKLFLQSLENGSKDNITILVFKVCN